MAIHFVTSDPAGLLKAFDARINQKEAAGKITTWEKAADGHYTHKATEWAKKAWFKPAVEAGQLTFNIIKPQNQNVSVTVYGYYHGHLLETFLNHFDKLFSSGNASALPEKSDNVGSAS
jgi:hypothetical protein